MSTPETDQYISRCLLSFHSVPVCVARTVIVVQGAGSMLINLLQFSCTYLPFNCWSSFACDSTIPRDTLFGDSRFCSRCVSFPFHLDADAAGTVVPLDVTGKTQSVLQDGCEYTAKPASNGVAPKPQATAAVPVKRLQLRPVTAAPAVPRIAPMKWIAPSTSKAIFRGMRWLVIYLWCM